MPYIINNKTLALLPLGKKTKILEWDKDFIVEESIINIIEHNCILNGSNSNCKWFILDNILKYYLNTSNKVVVMFKNNQKLELDLCYANFDKQVLRATRLESSLRGRKYKKFL